MNKRSFTWAIKKYMYFRKANMPMCARLELDCINGRLNRLANP